jgi:16S rRNA (guanine966-N2)-methyltransferase
LKSYEGEPFDLIFCDPPFTQELADEVMSTLAASKAFKENTLITIESSRREKIIDEYPPLVRYDFREFGDKYLSFFKRK